ncbi:hypothetical protein LPJ59_000746 [Coemansia sp. RSA 2399]|nr:hypothetical protein LPJ59_000746 [Coemansia sp. RSA 2399]
MSAQTADTAEAAAANSRDRAYLARSIAKCEAQLCANGFSEPLDATQIRRLSTIEGIIAQYRQLVDQDESEKDGNNIAAEFGDRIGDIEHQARAWVKKKDALVASLQCVGQDKKATDETAMTFVGTERDALQEVPDVFDNPAAGDNNEHWTDGVSPSDLLAGPPNEEAVDGNASSISNEASSGQRGSKYPETAEQLLSGNLASKRKELLGEMEGLRRRGVVPNNADAVERLLQSQRGMHDDLTDDLARMASVLKKNTVDFGELMEKDKKELDETAQHLEKSAAGVGKHGVRLNKYRKRAWGTTGLTWLAVLVVVSVFFILVLFMRVAPKRY